MKATRPIPLLIFSLSIIPLILLLSAFEITAKPSQYPWGCEVHVYKNLPQTNNLKEIGLVQLMDPLRTTNQSKYRAILLFRYMACAMGANVINITEEQDSSKPYGCYLAKATFYFDTLNYVVGKEKEYQTPEIKPKEALFAFYDHIGLDYVDLNSDFWQSALSTYNFPAVLSPQYFLSFGIDMFYRDFYFNLTLGLASSSSWGSYELKCNINSNKFGAEVGYRIFNDQLIASPFLSVWYLGEHCAISQSADEIPLSSEINSPEILINSNQTALAIGLDLIIPVVNLHCIEIKFGYNLLNFTDYPRLHTEYNKISYGGAELIKNYFLGVSYTVGSPDNSK